MAPPFRSSQIGSLIRPQELVDARSSGTNFSKVSEDVKKLTDKAIADVVQQQLKRNVRPIVTGEYERFIFNGGFFENVPGFEVRELSTHTDWRSEWPPIKYHRDVLGVKVRPHPVTTGRIEFKQSVNLADFNYLKSLVPESQWRECKITMPALTGIHMALKPGTAYTPESGYTSDKEYLSALAAFFRAEFRALYDAGLRDIQIDDPHLTFFVMEDFREGIRKDGQDPGELLDLYIWAHNEALRDRPKDLHVGVHLCRGNFGKQHFATGSYEWIAKKLFSDLDFDTFYLEYDTDRAGDFEPLRFVPPGKNVVLGVVSTKEAELEDLHETVARVYQAADSIAKGQGRTREEVLDDLGVSPQCGFASFSLAKQMSMDRMWEKLELCRQIVKKVWGNDVN